MAALFALCLPHGALAAQARDTVAAGDQAPAGAPARDAYLDETARRLVLGARAARDTSRQTLDSYTAVIRERVGLGLPSSRRTRPWMNGERIARVRWSSDEPAVVRVLGARFRQPGFGANDPEPFGGIRAERFAADPLGDPFTFGFRVFMGSQGDAAIPYSPLDEGSERYYRFRSGDTLTVQAGDGAPIEVVAVTVTPRFAGIRLVSAIVWIDPESLGIARVAYRLAKPIDREMTWRLRSEGRWRPDLRVGFGPLDDADSSLADAEPHPPDGLPDRVVNGAFNSLFPRYELDISTVVADYGLWEGRHWLPRSATLRAHLTRTEGLTATGAAPPATPASADWTWEVESIRERGSDEAPGVPATAAEALRLWREERDTVAGELAEADPKGTVTIMPSNPLSLATGDQLPPSVWEGERPLDDGTLERLAAELAAVGVGGGGELAPPGAAPSPWLLDPPVATLRLLRYNPVERVSVGTRLQRDFVWGRAVLTARVGTAGLDPPDVDLTLQRDHSSHRMLVSFYRSLRHGAAAPAVYLTDDPASFHWSQGAAIRFLPPAGERNWLSLRLFAERDSHFGFDGWGGRRVGAAAAWRPWWGGLGEGSFGGGGRASVRALTGDSRHARALVEAAVLIPMPARASLAVQAGSARVWGEPEPHDLWRVGGSGRWLRGHASSLSAPRIHMARVDVQRPVRVLGWSARLSAFGDWARASGDDFCAVGVGLVLGGLVRMDLARGLHRGREGGPDAVVRLHLVGDPLF